MEKIKRIVLLFIVFLASTPAKGCQNGGLMLNKGLKQSDREVLLHEHNRLRQAISNGMVTGQPSAQNMQEFQWDNELAERAQMWAEECVFRHDPKKYLKRFTMGQNLAIIWSSAELNGNNDDFPSRVRKWFDEVKKYSYGNDFSLQTGHYTQLIWADTNLVGCGYSYYYYRNRYNKLYVCNYGPAGNIEGVDPYVRGRPSCGSYNMQSSLSYPGLCTSNLLSPTTVPNNYYVYQVANEITTPDNNLLYNIVLQQENTQPPQTLPSVTITQSQPSTVVTRRPPLFPNFSIKSPITSYRWDLLFNLLRLQRD